mmetsp:Transcript_13458/g.22076  ORF Transcript_13458/g.22076 Transcript_13458/m.22076 type:complete len:207 (-) Transcript_13458:3770-4390(-)
MIHNVVQCLHPQGQSILLEDQVVVRSSPLLEGTMPLHLQGQAMTVPPYNSLNSPSQRVDLQEIKWTPAFEEWRLLVLVVQDQEGKGHNHHLHWIGGMPEKVRRDHSKLVVGVGRLRQIVKSMVVQEEGTIVMPQCTGGSKEIWRGHRHHAELEEEEGVLQDHSGSVMPRLGPCADTRPPLSLIRLSIMLIKSRPDLPRIRQCTRPS